MDTTIGESKFKVWQVVVLVILLLGLGVGLYLVQRQQQLKSRAAVGTGVSLQDAFEIKDATGQVLPCQNQTDGSLLCNTSTQTVDIKVKDANALVP